MYYRNAQAAVVVYDVTKGSSLEKAKTWVKELQRQANPNIVIALVGNKLDLVQPSPSTTPPPASSTEAEDEADDATATPGEAAAGEEPDSLRQVPRDEAEAYAQEAGLLFFETSAKTGEGIVEIFTEIGQCLHLVFVRIVKADRRVTFAAKKIPIDQILASTRGGQRPGTAGSRAAQEGGVNLEENNAKGKDACNC